MMIKIMTIIDNTVNRYDKDCKKNIKDSDDNKINNNNNIDSDNTNANNNQIKIPRRVEQ